MASLDDGQSMRKLKVDMAGLEMAFDSASMETRDQRTRHARVAEGRSARSPNAHTFESACTNAHTYEHAYAEVIATAVVGKFCLTA